MSIESLTITASLTNEPSVILLAEDDPDDRELIMDAFKEIDASFLLQVVEDGKSALHYLQQTSQKELPCLIILDYNMPELNGAEVLEKICTDPRFETIPKVILSTSNNSSHIEECLKKGAHAYKVKPNNFNELVTIAQEMLELCQKAA